MNKIIENFSVDNVPIIRLENDYIKLDIAPSIGGRITSLIDSKTGYEFLWKNPSVKLKTLPLASPYDPNFYGGIDEIIPSDIPEKVDSLDYPDHGELWTTKLKASINDNSLIMSATLPVTGLYYERQISLRPDSPHIDTDYRIENPTSHTRRFLWKMHAALNIAPGDIIDCPASHAIVADSRWSKWKTSTPFNWPNVDNTIADVIPQPEGTMDFLFIYDLKQGRLGWQSRSKSLKFAYSFDTAVFPSVCYFASYGGFDGHFLAILEPCTAMPLMVNDAIKLNQCSSLSPGQSITTRITTYAGQ